MITAGKLGHRFDRWLFRRVTFELDAGEKLVITGSNGSGKSTLLKVLAGLLMPREGNVTVSGAVGYSALELAVYPQLSAKEHLALAAELRGIRTIPSEELARVGLEYAGDQLAGTFSTGMKARLKLALATQGSPRVLLFDEPTASLDAEGREIFDQTIQEFAGAVVIATNDEMDRRHATHEISLD
ncbi:ABC transporter ATP-binding protein [Kamptonema cortianum]|nr:ABC transporter ATP-binding protein [Geitlerinema splendidum]MDK3157608.1 ABC transporter ATP-binding protein [Kamptonema cortianum]